MLPQTIIFTNILQKVLFLVAGICTDSIRSLVIVIGFKALWFSFLNKHSLLKGRHALISVFIGKFSNKHVACHFFHLLNFSIINLILNSILLMIRFFMMFIRPNQSFYRLNNRNKNYFRIFYFFCVVVIIAIFHC